MCGFTIGNRVRHYREDQPETEGYGRVLEDYGTKTKLEWEDSGKTGVVDTRDLTLAEDIEE